MCKIISIHSYRGGTGKSNLSANLAAVLAMKNKRVAVVDTDVQSPGIHVILNIKQHNLKYSLNDYLWGKCEIEETVVPVEFSNKLQNNLFLVPSSTNTGDIARILHDGYNVDLLSDGFNRLVEKMKLDYLIIDTHPGLNEETLLSIAVSDKLLVVMRPDQQDFEGTSITLRVAQRLQVGKIAVVINKVPASLDSALIRQEIETQYNFPVAAVFPHSDELMLLGSKSLFCLDFPESEFTKIYMNLGQWLILE